MEKQTIFSCRKAHILLFILFVIPANSQQPPASAPSSVSSTNITAILEKAGQFGTLIRLLKSTQMAEQMNTQLNSSTQQGLTLFAPTDSAFSKLKPGTLNILTDQDKVTLLQFHLLPSMLSMSQFQTLSNPLRTQAGDNQDGQFQLNITSASSNQINITTGVVNTTVTNTLYSDNKLAVYPVDDVLLPMALFRNLVSSPSNSPAPAPVSSERTSSSTIPPSLQDTPVDSSSCVSIRKIAEEIIPFSSATFVAIWWL